MTQQNPIFFQPAQLLPPLMEFFAAAMVMIAGSNAMKGSNITPEGKLVPSGIELPPANAEQLARDRWEQLKSLYHTRKDLENLMNSRGIIKLYHGAPQLFAEWLVKSGPHVPYDVSPLARDVGKLYDLPWIVYQRYAYRKHEKVEKLSTSTAPVAARWAWSFRLGEILTDLNAHARMLVASRTYAKEHSIQVFDAYDKLYNQAIEIARATGGHVSSENAPDVLRLPDKLPLAHVGALVELTVNVSEAQEQCSVAIHDAGAYIRAVADGEYTEQDALVGWNNSYIDIRLDPSIIKSYRIVIKGMHSWEQDVIERMIQEGKLRG